jgi:tetratricopeptide (TPR) repeat protein
VALPLRPRPILLLILLALAAICPFFAQAQATEESVGGRVALVLPFDNRTGQPALDWIGESFADTLSQRLSSAGLLTISRDDRVYALDHLGLPTGFRPTRATTIRIAQTLDAEFVVVGSYTLNSGRVSAQAQVVQVNKLHMSSPVTDSADLAHLLDLENGLAWQCARQIAPSFAVAQQTFLAASSGVHLDAYESYIRGITATTDEERLQRLKSAVQLAPTYAPALLALGKLQYAQRQFDAAATTLAKVPEGDRLALEAGFYRGLSRFNTARYADAEAAFAFVAARLPLPEVVNNQGVALARQHKDGIPFFQRASTADPQDADYHFNLAVSLRRRVDTAAALIQIDQALKLRPNDTEATQLRASLSGAANGAAQPDAGFDPQERIRRTYSEASFRQAAFQLDQIRSLHMETLAPSERATQISQTGQEYLAQGLVLEAEREFQSALAADPSSATAHAGLAQVRERSGDATSARQEAQKSIQIHPNVAAYLVLARLDLQANQLSSSATNVASALQIDPNNGPARGMRQALEIRGQKLP